MLSCCTVLSGSLLRFLSCYFFLNDLVVLVGFLLSCLVRLANVRDAVLAYIVITETAAMKRSAHSYGVRLAYITPIAFRVCLELLQWVSAGTLR